MNRLILLFLWIGALSGEAFAQQRASCWPRHTAVSQRLFLDSENQVEVPVVDQGYPAWDSRTVLHIEPTKKKYRFSMRFRESFDEIGHSQNVYAMMILSDSGRPLFFEDFTGGCRAAGLSFFPRQTLELHTLDSKELSSDLIHVLIWSQ